MDINKYISRGDLTDIFYSTNDGLLFLKKINNIGPFNFFYNRNFLELANISIPAEDSEIINKLNLLTGNSLLVNLFDSDIAFEPICNIPVARENYDIIYIDIQRISIYNPEGSLSGSLIILKNITERKKKEDQQRQLEKINALGQMAGGIAHDFNNQLMSILGFANMLSVESENETLQYYAKMIIKSAEQSARLTRQLIDFSHKGKMLTVQIDIHQLIMDLIQIIVKNFDEKIKISVNLKADHPFILGDPEQIQNALLNLANNAKDAMQKGGNLTFTTKNVKMNQNEFQIYSDDICPGDYLCVSITDTGTGIPLEIINKIFDPFYSTKPRAAGSGMGLSAVQGMIKTHNGGIILDTKINKGSTFSLYFPSTAILQNYEFKFEEFKMNKGSGVIAILDDEDIVRDIVTEMLLKLGYCVEPFSSVRPFIEYFNNNHEAVDLVLLDMVLPEMTGIDVFKKIKVVNDNVKAFILSGYASEDYDEKEIYNAGIQGFIQKPVSMMDLSLKIKSIINEPLKTSFLCNQ